MSTAPRSNRARRDWGDDDSQTPILHVDMDSFFAEVEIRENPSLRGHPVIIGGSSNRGVVCSATYDARARGVHAAMSMSQAVRLCPEAKVLPVRHDLYGRVGAQVREIFYEYTPVVEPLSIDEAFLDVSGVRRARGRPLKIARDLRTQIRERLGLPASVGIGANKLVAKTASAHAKPDGLLLIPQSASVSFMQELPVGALFGVGAKTRERLAFAGIHTVGQLANTPLSVLAGWFGENAAERMLDLAWARDPRPVEVSRVDKSISSENTFATNLHRREQLEKAVLKQTHEVAARLRKKEMLAHTVGIKLRGADFQTITRSRTLPQATNLARDLLPVVLELLAASGVPRGGVRLVGVRAANLIPAQARLQLALDEDPRAERAEYALDQLHSRFGPDVITFASLLDEPGEL